jgi:surface protein
MNAMFDDAFQFNQDIGKWNVSRVTNMAYMFRDANDFDQDIGSWDVARVADMRGMFNSANNFNADIGSWDVPRVTNMDGMFADTHRFHPIFSPYNLSRVQFNQDISSWNVSLVTSMSGMFTGARSFHQNLCPWGPAMALNRPNTFEMFVGSACPNQNSPDVFKFPVQPLCQISCPLPDHCHNVTWKLYNSKTNALVMNLSNDTIVSSPPPCNRTNIKADVVLMVGDKSCDANPIQNITLELYQRKNNKIVKRRVEKEAPYFLFGNKDTNIHHGRIPPGTYRIRAIINGIYTTPMTTFTLSSSGPVC